MNTAAYISATALAAVVSYIAGKHEKKEDGKKWLATSLQTFNQVNLIYVSAIAMKELIEVVMEEII